MHHSSCILLLDVMRALTFIGFWLFLINSDRTEGSELEAQTALALGIAKELLASLLIA